MMWMSLSSSHIDRYPTLKDPLFARPMAVRSPWTTTISFGSAAEAPHCLIPTRLFDDTCPDKTCTLCIFMSKMWARKNKRITVCWDIHRWLTGTNVWTMLYISDDVSWWTLLLWADWLSLASTFWRLRMELWGMKYKSEVICWGFLCKA